MCVLEIAGLAKRFGRVDAVRDVSLRVERGDLYGLLGPNGSGKTTTLACALGLLRADRGHVRVLGHPAAGIHLTAGRVGVCFDDATLLPGLSAVRNLEYARRLLGHDGGRDAREALELVALTPHGSRRAGKLSLGQRRRLAIARALLGRPELLVLDEPLSGLDTVGVRGMLALFRRLRDDGLTLVLSSHRLHEMEQVVTRVGVILDGRLVREDGLDALLEPDGAGLEIDATPVDRARRVISMFASAQAVTVRGGTLELRSPMPAPEITRALVEAGCDVHAIRPRRASLQHVFETLVDAHAAGVAAPPRVDAPQEHAR